MGVPLPVPESFFILSLATPENNYFRRPFLVPGLSLYLITSVFLYQAHWRCQTSNQGGWQYCLPSVFSLSSALNSNVP